MHGKKRPDKAAKSMKTNKNANLHTSRRRTAGPLVGWCGRWRGREAVLIHVSYLFAYIQANSSSFVDVQLFSHIILLAGLGWVGIKRQFCAVRSSPSLPIIIGIICCVLFHSHGYMRVNRLSFASSLGHYSILA